MSYKSQLQTNNENLQGLIDKANALPDAGSGGSSVETCTVEITSVADIMISPEPPKINWIIATVLNEGVIGSGFISGSEYERKIDNVVCGSILHIHASTAAVFRPSSGIEELSVGSSITSRIYHITASAGETATITIS